MKTLIMSLLLIGFVPARAAEPQKRTESQSYQQKVLNQFNKLSLSAADLTNRLTADIRAKYGFDVSCDQGFWHLWGGLDQGSCYMGLETLDYALSEVNPLIDREQLGQIHIELGRTGLWQSITFDDKEMKVPYNADSARMAQFVNNQMKVLFGTSIADLQRRNHDLAAKLQSQYLFKVVAAKNIQTVEFHDGLRRLAVALQLVYGGARPSQEEASKFGFDTIVIGHSAKSLYEDGGSLRIRLASTERPGKMLMQMLHQVHGQPGYVGKIKEWIPTMGRQYTWPEVQKFDLVRDHVDQLLEWANTHIPNTHVGCILDRSKSRSVTVSECRMGLENLQTAFVKHGIPKFGLGVRKILIGSTFMGRSYVSPRGVLTVDYKSAPESLYEVATHR